jgi:uncharacterized protein YcgI (DUF1989 family)
MKTFEKIDRVLIPGAYGGTINVKKGQYISVVGVKGGQCADFWAIDPLDFDHFLSPAHFFIDKLRIQPKIGDILVSNRRLPMLTIVYDDVGWHDMLVPPCDTWRYEFHFGVINHRNCCDNFREAMKSRGNDWGKRLIPPTFNIFMNTFVRDDGRMDILVPTSKAGDRIIMRVEMDIIAVASACPMDLNETGARGLSEIELLVSDNPEALQVATINNS